MSEYSALDRVLHRSVLGGSAMGEILGDIDAALVGKAAAPVRDPVFVTGLARAGTTVLMRALHVSGQFASLTYADMPMVMAPQVIMIRANQRRAPKRSSIRLLGISIKK